ncbi:hypothetical protein [Candidatus Viridilinea mediisalina]|uniref:Uncharacterized protein n=1 Tax=Candidatus Viridilinea mediisalina TaxID=2024553 RepID=A0A2A6REP5_9CHLR|nr:hypothetical protein [Candidatus Viridilinea mediisalina]PDW01482.1 hypothetical protein CJ255_18940 [Candidatus Viridilinea mediisalina]
MGEADRFEAEERPQAVRLREIEADLAASLDPALRAEFADLFAIQRTILAEEDRTQQTPPREAATLDRATYDALLAICLGDPENKTPGRVPFHGTWYSVDTAALRRTPKAASFAMRGGPKQGRFDRGYLVQIGVGLLALVILLAIAWRPTQRPATAHLAPAPLLVNGSATNRWMPIVLTLPAATGESMIFAVQPVEASAWPAIPASPQTAGWRVDLAWPLELCLPRAAMPPAGTQVQIRSAHGAPERTYHLRAAHDTTGRTPPSLRLRACDGDVMLVGTLTQTLPAPHAALGEAQALLDMPSVAVVEIVARGPAVDAAIPAGRVQVEVVVQQAATADHADHADPPAALDWSAVRPELLLATGQTTGMSAPPQQEAAGRMRVRFLIPTIDAPVEALWRISDLTTGAVRDWRLTIPVPPTRESYLSEWLRVEPPQATQHDDGRLDLTLLLATTDGAPLALRYEDIRVTHDEASLPLPAMTQTDLTVSADEPLTVTCTVIPARGADGDLTVAIGHTRYAIVLPIRHTTGGGMP